MKNVLLIGMNFYDYEKIIIRRMKHLGFRVYHFADKPDLLTDHFRFNTTKLREQEIRNYQFSIIKKINSIKFNFILVIVGRFISEFFLEELHRLNPGAKFYLYLWDDVKRIKNFELTKSYYDTIFSFDPFDASNMGLKLLPLFYINNFYKKSTIVNCDYKYDLYSAMNCHSDREEIIYKVIRNYPKLRAQFILTEDLRPSINRRIKNKLINTNKKVVFRWRKINREKVFKGMLSSKAILDIQFPSQIGLTMRTFDVLSVERKLITTNQSIQYYDFYNSNNICIIDRNNPEISDGFLETQYKPLSDEVLDKYSLDSWLNVIFEGKKEEYLIEGNPYGL